MTAPRWSVVLDFDGTVTMEDVADSILRRYGGVGEREIRSSYHRGVITEDWVRQKCLQVRSPRPVLERYVLDTARPRPGLAEFVGWCRAAGVALEIVSGGLDLYVDLLLASWGLGEIPRYCARARCTPRGLSVRYPFLASGASLDSFKLARVRAHQRRGRKVLFAGDGTSDLPAARAADLTFARGALLRFLREERRSARPLRSFHSPRRELSTLCTPR